MLLEVLAACKDTEFWSWATCAEKELFRELEMFRRWSMICPCCPRTTPEERKIAAKCTMKSRRLHQASGEVQRRLEAFSNRANGIRNPDCEGFGSLRVVISSCLRLASTELSRRFKYLSKVPWTFVLCDTRGGAVDFLSQADAFPMPQQDELTQRLISRFRGDLEVVANGGALSDALRNEIDIFRHIPLDESAGEGYHRSSHHTKNRAPAARAAYIKQEMRLAESIERCRTFIKNHGSVGRQVFNFEYNNFRRILQTSSRRKIRSVRMTADAVYSRIYREDDIAKVNWESVCVRCPVVPARPMLQITNSVQIQREYLLSVFHRFSWYHVVSPREPIPGAILDVHGPPDEEERYFQVLAVQTARSRPKTMPTLAGNQSRADKI